MVKSTKAKAPFKVGYVEEFEDRTKAMWREWEFKKKWNTERKKKLIAEFASSEHKQLSGL